MNDCCRLDAPFRCTISFEHFLRNCSLSSKSLEINNIVIEYDFFYFLFFISFFRFRIVSQKMFDQIMQIKRVNLYLDNRGCFSVDPSHVTWRMMGSAKCIRCSFWRNKIFFIDKKSKSFEFLILNFWKFLWELLTKENQNFLNIFFFSIKFFYYSNISI